MQRTRTKAQTMAEDNSFSLSLGDLMAGLLLIFVLLLSFAMLRLEDLIAEKRGQLETINEQEQIKKRLISRLMEELSEYDVEVDPHTGVIRIKEGVLFDFGRHNLKPPGMDLLRRVIPTYAKIVLSDSLVHSHIAQVIVEGHTDNVGGYQYNLDLSLRRAYSVTDYMFAKEFGAFPYAQDLQNLLSANGRSFVEPRASNNTSEGRELNRRVELQFRLKDWDMIAPVKRKLEELEGGGLP